MRSRLLFILMLVAFLAEAKPNADTRSTARFTENKGQWESFFDYRLQMWQGNMYVAKNKFIYELYDNAYMNEIRSHHHAKNQSENEAFAAHSYEVVFLNANPQTLTEGGDAYGDYQNYYVGANTARWREHVSTFAAVNYNGLYKGINMKVYGKDANLKYDFMLEPYANPGQIQLQYNYVNGLSLVNGNLHIETAVGIIKELAPVAYQMIQGKKNKIECHYVLDGNVLSFSFPNGYDPNEFLIIDPVVVFSTYTGSSQDNWGFTATYDANGNGYSGGIIFQGSAGNTGYPTMGAYQTSYQGGERDVVITKFNPSGTNLIFSTYLGGSQIDQPHSLVVDNNGDLFVFGRSSSGNFPTTSGAYDRTLNGGFDLFVTKFGPSGALLASTFLGGSANDGVNISADDNIVSELKFNYGDDARGEIIVDGTGNVYIAGCTNSNNFPTTAGCFRPNFGGQQDGIVAKFNNNLTTLVWSSYLGGSDLDAAYAMQLDEEQNYLFVTGGTKSSNFPTTSGAYQTGYNGGIDGFISKISTNGTTLYKSTYIGTSGYDQSFFIQLDKDDEVYVLGQTLGPFPKTPGTYGQNNSRQFITKMDNNLSTISVSTTFGTVGLYPNISPTAFLVDRCKNIYACGWGDNSGNFPNSSGTTGLPVSPNAHKSNTDGNDFYIIVMKKDMQSLLYATYFGGNAMEHVDGGTSRFDKQGIIYEAVCAGCGGSDAFPTTQGAWSNTNDASNCNLALFKIDLQLTAMTANFLPENTNGTALSGNQGCAPLTVNFDNSTVGNNAVSTTYYWDLGEGGATSTQENPTHVYNFPGTYQIMLISSDPNSCNLKDTVYKIITVYPPPVVDAGTTQYICTTAGETANLSAVVTSGTAPYTYSWSPPNGLNSINIQNPVASPTTSTLYMVNVTDIHGCKASDTVHVYTNQLQITVPANVYLCPNQTVSLVVSAANAVSFSWSPSTGLSANNVQNPVAFPTTTTTYTVYATTASGCTGENSLTVNVLSAPSVNIGADKTICYGDTVLLNAVAPTATVFIWNPQSFLSNPSIANPLAYPTTTTQYVLAVRDAFGCQNWDTLNINVRPKISLTVGPDTLICQGANVQLYSTTNTNGLSYSWSPSFNLNNATIKNPVAASPPAMNYVLTVTDNIGCTQKDTASIEVFETQTIADAAICFGDTITLTTTGGATFSWSPITYLSAGNIPSPLAFPPNDITYSVTATSSLGCISTKFINITVNQLPAVSAGNDTSICRRDTISLNGSGGIIYSWSPSAGLNAINILNPAANPDTTTTYTLEVTDALGCKNKDMVQITVMPLPILTLSPADSVCWKDLVNISASGAVSYSWSPSAYLSDVNVSNPYANPEKSIRYMVTGTGANGCKDTSSVPITVVYKGETKVDGPSGICPGQTVNLVATGAQIYSWNTGDTNDSLTFIPTQSQWYICRGFNNNCSALPDSIYIDVTGNVSTAAFTCIDSAFAPTNVYFQNNSNNAYTYSWFFDDGGANQPYSTLENPSHIYTSTGEYTITLITYSYYNCTDTVSHTIVVEGVTLFLPSAISPNNDNINDVFLCKYYGIKTFNIQIYDRWGTKIFQSDDKDFIWDGTAKGKAVPEGVYVWHAEGIGENGLRYEQVGTVTIIR